MTKTIERLAEQIRTGKAATSEMSAYEIATALYGDEQFADIAAQETRRAGWKFAGYDWNGDEVYTP